MNAEKGNATMITDKEDHDEAVTYKLNNGRKKSTSRVDCHLQKKNMAYPDIFRECQVGPGANPPWGDGRPDQRFPKERERLVLQIKLRLVKKSLEQQVEAFNVKRLTK